MTIFDLIFSIAKEIFFSNAIALSIWPIKALVRALSRFYLILVHMFSRPAMSENTSLTVLLRPSKTDFICKALPNIF